MAMELIAGSRMIRLIALGCFVFLLVACPRIAYISIYNNTHKIIEVDISGQKETIEPGTSQTIQFTGSEILVKSEGGSWKYKRIIPHSGERGSYFDGILRVQINNDFKIYVIPVSETAPLDRFDSQPEGYPLSHQVTGMND